MESLEPSPPQQLRVEIVYSPRAGHVEHARLTLAAGATLADALRESAFAVPDGATIGIWGRLLAAANALATPLHDRDRIEFHRPLAVDPMEARRRRARGQRGAAAVRYGRP
jgi:putative ubiquitin-RnfH superfamily antitoxin RatB of RatAB toxin-antitoxin module